MPGDERGVSRSEERLLELGDEIEHPRQGRGHHARRKGRRRWSTRRKVGTVLAAIVLLAGGLVAGGYAYLHYEWGRVHKIACTTCTSVADGKPFNVLVIGSDSRAGNTGQAAQSFGTPAITGGQRSDTIKIVRIDPKSGTARILSIPRDTYVTMSGLDPSTGLTGSQKINAAFNNGQDALIETIKNTFGISISHFIIVDFNGVIHSVNALHGVSLDFKYPVRDNASGVNESGLSIATTGCQTLNGNETVALSRSRYYQYYAGGEWLKDPGSDISRISRQNTIIEAMVKKAGSTYNPLTLQSLLNSVVNDVSIDKSMSPTLMYDLAERYHAFSPSRLEAFTLPTTGVYNSYGSAVEIVDTMSPNSYVDSITQFLGGPPAAVSTPPLDQHGNPVSVHVGTVASSTTTTPATTTTEKKSPVTTTTAPSAGQPSYDPTIC